MVTFWVAPAARIPVNEPVSVATVVPDEFLIVEVMPCEPLPEEMLPWFFSATVKATDWPPEGLLGVHEAVPMRSELCTWPTTRFDEAVKVLLASLSSMMLFDSSILAL